MLLHQRKQMSLRYLEFAHFDEKAFLTHFAEYLRHAYYTDHVSVQDTRRRKGPSGDYHYTYTVCLEGKPLFELMSHTDKSCLIGAAPKGKSHAVHHEALLDAFLSNYMQPENYLHVQR